MSAGHSKSSPLGRPAIAPARGGKSKRARPAGGAAAIPSHGRDSETSLARRVTRWALSFTAAGYAMSVLLHAAALAFLSLIVVAATEKDESFTTTIIESDDDVSEFVEVIDTRMEVVGSESPPVEVPQMRVPETTELVEPVLSDELINRLAVSSGEGSGEPAGSESPGGGIPRGRNAVTKGSFTAWTVPDDPAPYKPYYIVIEIKVPENVRRYPLSDLKGELVGTDNWRQSLPWEPRDPTATRVQRRGRIVAVTPKDNLPIKNGRAQVLIRVQAADPEVQDTIQIESRMLNESQKLMIEF